VGGMRAYLISKNEKSKYIESIYQYSIMTLQSLVIRLETSDEDKARLLETMRRYNEACNYVADKTFSLRLSNKIKLQQEVYHDIRSKFNLSSQFAIRVISKVVESYKRDKTIKPVFRELGSIQYDQRNSKVSIDRVSLMTLQGRLKLATRIGEYQKARFDRVRGQCDLYYKNKQFYIIVVVDAPDKSEYDPVGVLGVDLGIVNLAVDSDRQIFESKKIEQTRQHYNKRRSGLQKVGTRSAKRKLKKLSGKERRFKKDTNHIISKKIVSKSKGTTRAIAIEDLSNIRTRVTVRKGQRDKHSKWAFDELRKDIEYKVKNEGVPLIVVQSKNTSRECPQCHYIDKRNRKSRNDFECLQCHYKEMADYVAALNIRDRVSVNKPMVAPLFSVVTNPHLSRVGG
jgi:IS605 OrfB family transposase